MTQNRDTSLLDDVVLAAGRIRDYVIDKEPLDFDADPMCISAVTHQLIVVGNAMSRVSKEFQAAHPQIPWRKWVGMRFLLVNAYHDISIDEVWQTALIALPPLANYFRDYLEASQKPV